MKKLKCKRKIMSLLLCVMVALGISGGSSETAPLGNERNYGTKQNTEADLAPMTVHYLDVGQGDCTLIVCGDSAMLIDAGGEAMGTAVQLYLKKQGISRLDYVIVTHFDEDHIGGLDVILTKFDCGTIIMPEYEKETAAFRNLLEAMKYRNYKNTFPEVGKTYHFGDGEFTILSPDRRHEDSNNNSVSLIIRHGEKRFLFTGDAEETGEQLMLENGLDLSCDVYQAGHHGSAFSSTSEFLDAAKPAWAVISCGEGNSYGHPRAKTLNAFRSRGIKVFRTDEQGTLVASSDGEKISWNCSPSETWKAGEPSLQTSKPFSQKMGPSPDSSSPLYVLNQSSKKFHLPSCDSLPTGNRKDTNMSRKEILDSGYAPCKRCRP